ncbi:MAG: hypothetical protein MHPSP_004856, partial [Paramarteilia canceri]
TPSTLMVRYRKSIGSSESSSKETKIISGIQEELSFFYSIGELVSRLKKTIENIRHNPSNISGCKKNILYLWPDLTAKSDRLDSKKLNRL